MDKNPNTGYMCFLSEIRFLGVKVPKDYEKRFLEKENTFYELVRTAKDLGLKAAAGKLKIKKLDKTTAPVIAKLKNDGYLLLVSHQNHTWVVLNPLKGTPESMDEKQLFQELSGEVIILGKGKAQEGENGNKKFGFGWFIPTIMKFKRQFICVLIAVFFIQILGILTPLMTQVVVDKVLAHHAMNAYQPV